MNNRNLLPLCAGLALLLATGCSSNVAETPEYKALQTRNDSLSAQVASKDQEVEDVAATVNEIENNLAAIEKDQLSISDIKKEGQEGSQKDKINAMIAGIDNYIEQNRQKIERLEKQVSKKSKSNASLQKLVANLRASIAAKEEEITNLRSTIAGLETENTGLKGQVAEGQRNVSARDSMLAARQRDIESRDTEINTVYYISGSKKDLEKAGVIDVKRGFIGIGKSEKLSGRIDKSKFTAINKLQTDDISLGVLSQKPTILTTHPTDSYALIKQGEEMHLKITDQRKFWSLSTYFVAQNK